MPIRLIALDIDGTLLDTRWQVSELNRQAVQEATRRGIEVALVTGRRYDFALPVARSLGCPITMIVNNGGLIRSSEGRTMLRRQLPIATARAVLKLAQRWRAGAAVIFDRPRENQLMLEQLDPADPLRYGYYSRNLDFIGVVCPLENSLTEMPLQVMFSGTLAEMEALEELLLRSPLASDIELAATKYASKDFAMLDVLPPGCTKGAALADWARARGLQRDEILAVGDNHNDLEMLRFAGTAVVMQNCVPELKTHGWHQTSSNDESGVAAAIKRFALSRGGMVRLIMGITLGVALGVCAAGARADYLVLRNGARLNVSAYQLLGDRYRIQVNGGSAEIAAAEVLAIEPEEIFVAAPRMPLTQAPFGELIRGASQKYAVDADLLFSVIAAESNFNARAVSRRGARGLMQLLPATAARLGVKDIFDPAQNIDAGTRYLRELMARYQGDLALTLAAYNAGPGAVQHYGRVPPYSETVMYVRAIRKTYAQRKLRSSADAASRTGSVSAAKADKEGKNGGQ